MYDDEYPYLQALFNNTNIQTQTYVKSPYFNLVNVIVTLLLAKNHHKKILTRTIGLISLLAALFA